MSTSANKPEIPFDAVIVGGGIAGLWLLNLLIAKGYRCVLLEADRLGCGQSLASQGMIHGGLKYALGGSLSGASEAIAAMPERWRACLGGNDPVDLRNTRKLSERYYMFAERSAIGRMTTFFASKTLRGRIDKLDPDDWPGEYRGFDGIVYALNDFVLDTPDLLRNLAMGHEERILHLNVDSSNVGETTKGYTVELSDCVLQARNLISCAGNGSADLLKLFNIADIEMQQRPLKQVIAKPTHGVSLCGHCLTGIRSQEPRLTITSHPTDNAVVWYIGGQLAEQGANLDDEQLIELTKSELATCVPWLSWQNAQYSTLTINRAEPKQTSGTRPDEAYAARSGQFIQCFPTKLTLAPDLGDRVLELLDAPQPSHNTTFQTNHHRAQLGTPPWQPQKH